VIHDTTLPEIARDCLEDVVVLQLNILHWASLTSKVDKKACREWLITQEPYCDRAADIASWLWNSEKRYKPLEEFASEGSEEKEAWSKRLTTEARCLLEAPEGTLEALNPEVPSWQKAGTRFLVQFYDDFRGRGLPGCLFTNDEIRSFGAQDFLKAYINENNRLCVCPVCDETGFFTVSGDAVRTDIDHYLPKSYYPHLAVHPFNLLPLCHLCNSAVKGQVDPLDGGDGRRRSLQDIWLPYRENGLSTQTFLEVNTYVDQGTDFFIVQPRSNGDLRERIDVLAQVFDLPQRWSERRDQIGEKLFRRIRSYSRYIPISEEEMSGSSARDPLDELLGIFYTEDLSREPFVFPMAWWLAKLIDEELAMEETPLLKELRCWVHVRAKKAVALQSRGQEIRGLVRQR
jgi:hypothetical protein